MSFLSWKPLTVRPDVSINNGHPPATPFRAQPHTRSVSSLVSPDDALLLRQPRLVASGKGGSEHDLSPTPITRWGSRLTVGARQHRSQAAAMIASSARTPFRRVQERPPPPGEACCSAETVGRTVMHHEINQTAERDDQALPADQGRTVRSW